VADESPRLPTAKNGQTMIFGDVVRMVLVVVKSAKGSRGSRPEYR